MLQPYFDGEHGHAGLVLIAMVVGGIPAAQRLLSPEDVNLIMGLSGKIEQAFNEKINTPKPMAAVYSHARRLGLI